MKFKVANQHNKSYIVILHCFFMNIQTGNRWESHLKKASEHLKIADNMAYVGFSILGEIRVIMKILTELSKASVELIKSYLYYESFSGRVRLYEDPVMNLESFFIGVGPKYLSRNDLDAIKNILQIEKRHKEASMEFVRKDKFVIMIGDRYEVLSIGRVRELLRSVRIAFSRFPRV